MYVVAGGKCTACETKITERIQSLHCPRAQRWMPSCARCLSAICSSLSLRLLCHSWSHMRQCRHARVWRQMPSATAAGDIKQLIRCLKKISVVENLTMAQISCSSFVKIISLCHKIISLRIHYSQRETDFWPQQTTCSFYSNVYC